MYHYVYFTLTFRGLDENSWRIGYNEDGFSEQNVKITPLRIITRNGASFNSKIARVNYKIINLVSPILVKNIKCYKTVEELMTEHFEKFL